MRRLASVTVLFVVFVPATVQAFDHHHHHEHHSSSSSESGGGCDAHSSDDDGDDDKDAKDAATTTTVTKTDGGTTAGSSHVFVTSTLFSGGVGSVAAADARCQEAAVAGGLTGVYHAWVSTAASNAADRVTGAGPWSTTGNAVAFPTKADIAKPSLAPLLDEHGKAAPTGATFTWSGTDADGKATALDCDAWTNATKDATATTRALAPIVIDGGAEPGAVVSATCDLTAPLLCLSN